MFFRWIKWIKNFFTKKTIIAKCGHETSLIGEINIFSHKIQVRIKKGVGIPNLCLHCYEKKSILCGWCREPITPGDPITLYSPKNPDWQLPEGARWWGEKGGIARQQARTELDF